MARAVRTGQPEYAIHLTHCIDLQFRNLTASAMKNDANLYAFGRLTDEICDQFRTAVFVLAIHGKIDGGATTGAATHYPDTRNLRRILSGIWGPV